jgi:hypothetical protein
MDETVKRYPHEDSARSTPVTVILTMILGVVLLAVAVLGMLTGSHDHLLMGFGVNGLHNWVHLLSGGMALFAAIAGTRTARAFCLAFAAVYGLVCIAGFAQVDDAVRLLNLNQADNFLHLGIVLYSLVVGLVAPASITPPHSPTLGHDAGPVRS